MITLEKPHTVEVISPETIDDIFQSYGAQVTRNLHANGLTDEQLLPVESLLNFPLRTATEGIVPSADGSVTPEQEKRVDEIRGALFLEDGETPVHSYTRTLYLAIDNHSREWRRGHRHTQLDDGKDNWFDAGGPLPAPVADALKIALTDLNLPAAMPKTQISTEAFNSASNEFLQNDLKDRANKTRKIGTIATLS